VANEISRLRAELAATKHLLHESLQREDRFYRELAAANKEIDRLNRYVDTFRSDEQLMGELKCAEAFHRCAVAALRAQLAAKDAEIARLREAANAVVERWETPLWKDVKPTAHIIYALRDELAAQQQASK
jgi:uncharacterized coiled-coil protein SlyX